MGVTGLWKLIEPCGKPVPVETLEGKILAIDISIWLHQVVKGFQDQKGNALANAHLLGLFHRLCKLLYYRVRPVFVFDGCVPQLKRETIARRQQQRDKLSTEADRIQHLLVQQLAKEKVVQQALGANTEALLKSSPAKRPTKSANAEDSMDEMFKLPELPAGAGTSCDKSGKDGEKDNADGNNSSWTSCTTDDYDTEESSFDESNRRYAYDTNLQAIDVRSQHFRTLPAEVRHEILVDIKETRKHSWGRLHELPACSNDFSSFQMKRLLKRRAVQESLEEVQQEIGGRSLTYSELVNFFTEEGILEPSNIAKATKQICSDENTRFLLVRDLKKKLAADASKTEDKSAEVKIETPKEEAEGNAEDKNQKKEAVIEVKDEDTPELGDEFDYELQRAIALSLEQDGEQVYDSKDYDYEGNAALHLNRQQRRNLSKATVGPARAYMIEYAGVNESELADIMEETQTLLDDALVGLDSSTIEAIKGAAEAPKQATVPESIQEIADSDTDSDLEEVVGDDFTEIRSPKKLEIVVDTQNSQGLDDDMFADIFEEELKCTPVQATAVVSAPGKSDNPQKDMPSTEQLAEKNAEKEPSNTPTAVTSPNVMSILDELKKQAEQAVSINLSDIELKDTSIIELSDEELPSASIRKKDAVIELFASEHEESKAGLKTPSKSPRFKSPHGSPTIKEYFQTDYLIKRTPEKLDKLEDEAVPKVKSPFFVKKTPKATRTNSPSPTKRTSKVAKTLFEPNDSDNVPTTSTQQKPSVEETLAEVAQTLKEQNTEQELHMMANDLARERRQLESERNRQDRMGMSISQRMNMECQELLRLFGIPYIVAPMEAEAQCAFLEEGSLTNGTITDDSDIWLFGGRTVYKNFFAQNKHVLEFRAEQIEETMNCDRKRLIQLACLVGSDYTNGIHGIGTVTALEILASFGPSKDAASPSQANMRQVVSTVLSTLSRFRDWWAAHKTAVTPPGNSARLALRKKLKNVDLDEGFPSMAVVEAYMLPKVDESKEAFSWGHPDEQSIRDYAKKHFGWTTSKTDDILNPVLKKLNEKKSQASIKNYFAVRNAVSNRQLTVSKRVKTAIDKLSGNCESDSPQMAEEAKEKPKRRTKRKQAATELAAKPKIKKNSEKTSSAFAAMSVDAADPNAPTSSGKGAPHIPPDRSSVVIPQREKTRQQMEKNKEKAAQIMKKASKAKAKA